MDSTKKWSKKFDCCVKCGTTKEKHSSRGFCRNCYDKASELKHKDVNRIRKYGNSSSILTRDYLIDNYVTKQNSLADIAKSSNCSRQYVHKKIVSFGIPLRDKSTSRIIAQERGKVVRENVSYPGTGTYVTLRNVEVNEEFFKTWNPEMAYVLGIIYTDGNLFIRNQGPSSKVYLLSIAQKETELLEKVLSLMQCNAKLMYSKRRVYKDTVAGELYKMTISNKKIYHDLEKIGLTPDKSNSIDFPVIPEEHVRHFMRGCWDGDGSVYIEKRNNTIKASFTSGSLKFIEGMVAKLEKAGFLRVKIYSIKRKNISYYFRITGQQVKYLYHYLYNDVPETQYLKRKYNLFSMTEI